MATGATADDAALIGEPQVDFSGAKPAPQAVCDVSPLNQTICTAVPPPVTRPFVDDAWNTADETFAAARVYDEEWRAVEGFPLYEVSTLGHVRNAHTMRLLTQRYPPYTGKRKRDNYHHVLLHRSGEAKRHTRTVHGLVARAFLRAPPRHEFSINHLNGCKSDNRLENLEWASPSAQRRHALAEGLAAPFRRRVQRLAPDGRVEAEFRSVTDASARSRLSRSTITLACKADATPKSAARWRYEAARVAPLSADEAATEQWRPACGPYEVSSVGRVRRGPLLLRQYKSSTGYRRVSLVLDGKPATRSVHRLVAAAFVPNPRALGVVNHLDRDRDNNRAANLEWTSTRGNIEAALAKPVERLVGGVVMEHFSSVAAAGAAIGRVNAASAISACCRAKRCSAYGSRWRYSSAAAAFGARVPAHPSLLDHGAASVAQLCLIS